MVLSLKLQRVRPLLPVPMRRRIIVLGATEAGVAAAFHLGKSALIIDKQGSVNDERVALYAAAADDASGNAKRWELPELQPGDDIWHQLTALVSGEVRLGSIVVAIDTHERRLQLSTGESYVYDKLICTLRLEILQRLFTDEQPTCIRGADWWRCWLSSRGIELLDAATQLACGDVDGETAGKRVADAMQRALVEKYSRPGFARRPEALFQPKLVS